MNLSKSREITPSLVFINLNMNKLKQMDEIRDKYLKPYIDNGLKVPKETWHLIKKEIDKLLQYGK